MHASSQLHLGEHPRRMASHSGKTHEHSKDGAVTSLKEHCDLMRVAIAEAEKSKPVPSAYCVGCVIVEGGRAERLHQERVGKSRIGGEGEDSKVDEARQEPLGLHRAGDELRYTFTGFSRELPGNTHAEECALIKASEAFEALKGDDAKATLKGCDMYATMEPCSKRLSGKVPCVERCLAAGVGRVFVGVREPDHFVRCEGVAQLREAGVCVIDVRFPGCEQSCLKPNAHIPGLKALAERLERREGANQS